ncbi:siderophore biosynthesis diaminobutyrate-2-oxoglutarate aminotransferase [Vibrio maritimus]|uniref:Siderophore biosynthesis diaminobutyrate-2-oxoglutarate aminotransferase n=1 Tax=Vibrio maritimus TaxID=990268 RepID=A0A090T1I7_9VIBR|nr:siderophore biosynthesis diaminobutyrate-2-oxoglutarate aminotransferase [Vibrio maritimus]
MEDTRGQIFLDCLAGAGTLAMGYNHPEINQALKEQLDSGLPYQTLDITTEAKDRFIKRVKAFLPEQFAADSVIQFCGPSGLMQWKLQSSLLSKPQAATLCLPSAVLIMV